MAEGYGAILHDPDDNKKVEPVCYEPWYVEKLEDENKDLKRRLEFYETMVKMYKDVCSKFQYILTNIK